MSVEDLGFLGGFSYKAIHQHSERHVREQSGGLQEGRIEPMDRDSGGELVP